MVPESRNILVGVFSEVALGRHGLVEGKKGQKAEQSAVGAESQQGLIQNRWCASKRRCVGRITTLETCRAPGSMRGWKLKLRVPIPFSSTTSRLSGHISGRQTRQS